MSEESKHTPGPWTLIPDDVFTPDSSLLKHQRIVGANLISPGIVFGGLDECKGNALLIAAAPDLLAACQKFVDSFKSLQREKCDIAHRMAIEAIAKAVGR